MWPQSKIIILGLLCVVFCDAQAKQIPICQACDISSLEIGLNMADSHDSLFLESEKYIVVNLEIRKPISIVGKEGTVFDGNKMGYIIKVLSDSVNISKVKLINSGKSYTKDYAAIYISNSRYFSVIGCKFENPFFGMLVEKSHNGRILDNYLSGDAILESDAANGIHVWHCSNVYVANNEVSGMRDGIYFEFVSESLIEQNFSHDNIRYGLHFMFSNDDKYYDNEFRSNGAGVAVMFSKFIEMKRNIFTMNWGTASYGLLLKEIYDAEVENNSFDQNTIGIFLEGSTRINYTNNNFLNNGWAVKVSGGRYKNIFSNNNFISNALDVSYNSKMNDNSFNENYWSEYNGYDLDKNGIGDVPYRPVKLFSYIVSQTPESIVLLRSLFIDILNFSEKVSPIFTPDNLLDNSPAMAQYP